MKFKTLLLATSLTSFLIGCSNGSDSSPNKQETQGPDLGPQLTEDDVTIISSDVALNPAPAEVDLIFAKNQVEVELPQRASDGFTTHIIEDTDIVDYQPYEGNLILTYDKASLIVENDHLILNVENDSEGQLFKVIEIMGNSMRIEKATLQETLPNFDMQLDFTIEDITQEQSSTRAIEYDPPSRLNRRQYSTEFIPGVKVDTLMDFRNDFRVKYDLKVVDGVTHNFDMNFYSFVDTSMTLSLDRSTSTNWNDQKAFAPLFTKHFVMRAGPIPIPATIQVTPVIKGSVQSIQSLNAQISARAIAGGDLGITYENSEFNHVNNLRFNYLGKDHGITADSSFNADVALELKMTLTIFGKATDILRPGGAALSGPGGYVTMGAGLAGTSEYLFDSNQIAAECANAIDLILTRSVGLEPGFAHELFPDHIEADYQISFAPLSRNIWQHTCETPDTGQISGIVHAINSTPLAGAELTVQSGNTTIGTTTSNEDGVFTLANLVAGFHQLTISAEGYQSYTRNIQIQENTITHLSRALMLTPEQQEEKATLYIQAVNAQDPSETIDDALITLYFGADQINNDSYLVSYYSGEGFPLNLPLGQYTLVLSAEGYAPVTRVIDITQIDTNDINIPLSLSDSVDQAGDTARIVLTWGRTPSDLDSHLLTDYGHVYFSNKNMEGVNLDVDDTSSYGPETVTIDPLSTLTPYRYYIYNYSRSGTFTESEASITLYYQGNIRTFYPPVGSGYYWHVFDINNGQIVPCLRNCVSSSAPALGSTRALNIHPAKEASKTSNIDIR